MNCLDLSAAQAEISLPEGMTELVRGSAEALWPRLSPLAVRQQIHLDLARVERIDAAGISVLIALYAEACKAGQVFRVANPQPRVRELLDLVGLDRILLSHDVVRFPHRGRVFKRPAA